MSTAINPVSPLITGATITKSNSGGTVSSFLVTATTAQSSLDLSRLAIILENQSTTASVAVTITAGDDYIETVQGSKTVTVATAATVVVGGTFFESSRFLDSDGKVELTMATASTVYVSAIMFPFNTWNPA
jgi:hypothetical protein